MRIAGTAMGAVDNLQPLFTTPWQRTSSEPVQYMINRNDFNYIHSVHVISLMISVQREYFSVRCIGHGP